MTRRYILANTLNRHFIYFAKLMGIYPKLCAIYKEICHVLSRMDAYKEDDISFFSRESFNRYVDLYLRYETKHLNEDFVRGVYFYGAYASNKFKEGEVDELIDLFFSYLEDKKIYRNIRIERS